MDELLARLWADLAGRIGGPLTLRVVLQPLVASVLAVHAGIADGRASRPPYGWAVLSDRDHRRDLLREGWKAVGKVFLLALVLDCVYQVIVYRWIYPLEALLVAFVLAFVPYLLVRGPAGRLSRWLLRS